jgi:hypothetical protein
VPSVQVPLVQAEAQPVLMGTHKQPLVAQT